MAELWMKNTSRVIKVTLPKFTWHLAKMKHFRCWLSLKNLNLGSQLTYGEIECFMSHYNIWQDIVARNFHPLLILEDDIR